MIFHFLLLSLFCFLSFFLFFSPLFFSFHLYIYILIPPLKYIYYVSVHTFVRRVTYIYTIFYQCQYYERYIYILLYLSFYIYIRINIIRIVERICVYIYIRGIPVDECKKKKIFLKNVTSGKNGRVQLRVNSFQSGTDRICIYIDIYI